MSNHDEYNADFSSEEESPWQSDEVQDNSVNELRK